MQQIDCNPQFEPGIVRAGAKKVFIFSRVSRSDATAEILFAAPNCDARCLFALRELKPARLQPWLRSLVAAIASGNRLLTLRIAERMRERRAIASLVMA